MYVLRTFPCSALVALVHILFLSDLIFVLSVAAHDLSRDLLEHKSISPLYYYGMVYTYTPSPHHALPARNTQSQSLTLHPSTPQIPRASSQVSLSHTTIQLVRCASGRLHGSAARG